MRPGAQGRAPRIAAEPRMGGSGERPGVALAPPETTAPQASQHPLGLEPLACSTWHPESRGP
ncbi:hypothetical protein GH733_002088, partial [Mirounga leonina]